MPIRYIDADFSEVIQAVAFIDALVERNIMTALEVREVISEFTTAWKGLIEGMILFVRLDNQGRLERVYD